MRRAVGGAEQRQAASNTAVIGGGRDPGGAGGPRRPSNVDRSITAVDHPAIGAHIGARKHGSQIERPYWVDRALMLRRWVKSLREFGDLGGKSGRPTFVIG